MFKEDIHNPDCYTEKRIVLDLVEFSEFDGKTRSGIRKMWVLVLDMQT